MSSRMGKAIHLGHMRWGERGSEYPSPACGATPAFNITGDVEKFDADMQTNWAFDPTPYCIDCRQALGR